MNASTDRPTLCPDCTTHIEASNLHWVQCGGINVGMHRQPLVWRLRDKNEGDNIRQRTRDLQKMAAMARENSKLKDQIAALEASLG